MVPQEEECPVAESLLGTLYHSNPEGLASLVAAVPPAVRALLAIYCYRREHLRSLGLTIASSCDEGDLIHFAGKMGSAMWNQARLTPAPAKLPKISLSRAPLRHFIEQDLV